MIGIKVVLVLIVVKTCKKMAESLEIDTTFVFALLSAPFIAMCVEPYYIPMSIGVFGWWAAGSFLQVLRSKNLFLFSDRLTYFWLEIQKSKCNAMLIGVFG